MGVWNISDGFLAGFQEGGEFTAVISVKARNRQQAENIKAKYALHVCELPALFADPTQCCDHFYQRQARSQGQWQVWQR